MLNFNNFLDKIKNAGYVILLLFIFFSPNRKLDRRKYKLKRLYYIFV